MRFYDHFRLANYVLVIIGFLCLTISEFLSLPWIIVPLVVMGLAEHPSTRTFFRSLPHGLYNSIVIVTFVFLFFHFFIGREDLIAAVLYLTVVLQLVKILATKRHRDYFQIYILAFTHLIAATLLTADVVFILPFILFILTAPWAFTLFNLKIQLEQAYLGEQATTVDIEEMQHRREGQQAWTLLNRRGMVSNRFFAITALLSIALLSCTMAVFFLFPRVSFGYLLKKIRPHQMQSGFSDQVDLNSFGRIKMNQAVVLRSEILEGEGLILDELYWRGLVFDTYADNRWKSELKKKKRIPLHYPESEVVINKTDPQQPLRYSVILEPDTSNLLFAIDSLHRLSWDKLRLERMMRRNLGLRRDPYGSLSFQTNHSADRNYVGLSDRWSPSEDHRRLAGTEPYHSDFPIDRYTQLPEQLSSRFFDLAQTITRGANGVHEKAMAIKRYLAEAYEYTLNVPEYQDNPIEDFLFRSKRGHCEYFATAGTLLLRAQGIPARLVSGFRGGSWNDYGKYVTVRQRNAHTWIEIAYPGLGWLRYDPTPPDEAAQGYSAPRFAALRNLFEFMEYRWYKYIINYDLRMQFGLARNIWKNTVVRFQTADQEQQQSGFIRGWIDQFRRQAQTTGHRGRFLMLSLIKFLALVGSVVGCLLLIGRLIKRRRLVQAQKCPPFYRQFLKLWKRKGHPRKPHATAREHLDALLAYYPGYRSDLEMVVHLYHDVRFGRKQLDLVQREEMAAILKRLATLKETRGQRPQHTRR